YPSHSRSHGKRQTEKLKKRIRHFGQVVPIIVDCQGIIVDGHAVWKAMAELGAGEIAAVVVTNRTDPEIKALRLALNRIPRDAAWDDERLRDELENLDPWAKKQLQCDSNLVHRQQPILSRRSMARTMQL